MQHKSAEGGAGECSRLEIVHYIGIGRVELARSVRDVVSALGDGERYDFRRFGCHLFDHRLRILWSEQVLDDRPDDPGLEGSVGMLERQRVEAVLRAECVFIRLSDGITPTPQIPQSKPSPRRRRASMYMAWCAR